MENFLQYIRHFFHLEKGILITPKNAKKKMENYEIQLVIDARTRSEWDYSHFKGARNIHLSSVTQLKFSELHENSGIIVYCNNGSRASKLAACIKEYGFNYVYYIDTSHWELI